MLSTFANHILFIGGRDASQILTLRSMISQTAKLCNEKMVMKRIRFGELDVGDIFSFSGKSLKKIDEFYAVTLEDCGKQNFLFQKRNLVVPVSQEPPRLKEMELLRITKVSCVSMEQASIFPRKSYSIRLV